MCYGLKDMLNATADSGMFQGPLAMSRDHGHSSCAKGRWPDSMELPSAWFMMHGSWFMVHGSWFMMHGSSTAAVRLKCISVHTPFCGYFGDTANAILFWLVIFLRIRRNISMIASALCLLSDTCPWQQQKLRYDAAFHWYALILCRFSGHYWRVRPYSSRLHRTVFSPLLCPLQTSLRNFPYSSLSN